jgi:flagellar basal-body rod modification protein FlgD
MNMINGSTLIDQDRFLTLLLAGLRHQDPLQPVDNNQFLGQLTQFANLQAMQNLNTNFEQMLRLQQLTQGASLLGKRVQYLGDGNLAVGRVAGVVVDRGKILLDLGGSRIALDAVQSFSD